MLNYYLEVNMNSFLCFVPLVNPRGERWDVVASIRFSSYIEVIFSMLRMLSEKCLRLIIKKVNLEFLSLD